MVSYRCSSRELTSTEKETEKVKIHNCQKIPEFILAPQTLCRLFPGSHSGKLGIKIYSEDEKTWILHIQANAHEGTFARLTIKSCPFCEDKLAFKRGKRREFSYSIVDSGIIKIGISPDHYGKSLRVIRELATELRSVVPFEFSTISEPEVHVLGGRRKKGIISVEMEIGYTISDKNAISQLKKKGFYEGFELILG